MNRIFLATALLFSAPALLAAPADPPLTTGMWVVDGDVMGTPVKMTCTLVEKDHKLTGSCAAAADNFTPHIIAGKVKDQTFDLYFQTDVQGNPITLNMSGKLSDDRQKASGDLDVEPMQVSGSFTAKRVPDSTTPAAAPAPAVSATPDVPVVLPATIIATGVWKVDGDVMGTPVKMTCTLAEKEHKLAGSCVGADGDPTPRTLVGETKANLVTWQFGTVYNGNPITVALSATLGKDGAAMSGGISVPELQADGTFTAKRQ